MSGRPLKNFDLYIDKLRQYARACEITIEYRVEPGDGMYIPSRRKIILDKDLPESTEIATLLHELGHSTDDHLPKTGEGALERAYRAFYKNRYNAKQSTLVIECEKRAWAFGRSIAKILRIPIGAWFDKEERDALRCYRKGVTSAQHSDS